MDAECGDGGGEGIARLAKRLWSNKRALEKFDPSIVVDLAILMQKGEVLIRQAFLDRDLDLYPYPETFHMRDVAWVNPRWEMQEGLSPPPITGTAGSGQGVEPGTGEAQYGPQALLIGHAAVSAAGASGAEQFWQAWKLDCVSNDHKVSESNKTF